MANVMETIQNKYKVWHDNIIANGKKRKLIGYKEVHHILPKSLGGSNDKSNLVELTAREHFLVHLLLCKFTIGKEKHKMLYSFNAMRYIKSKGRDYKINSKIAQKLRSQLRHSKETKLKMSESQKGNKYCLGFKHTKESRLKMSNAQKGNKKAVGNTNNLGRKFSKETKLRMSKSKKGNKNALGLIHSEEFKERIRKINTGNKTALGRKHINKDGKSKMVNANEVDKYLNKGYKLGMDKSYITLEYRKHQSDMAKAYYRRSA
jgi:hypothetical protein